MRRLLLDAEKVEGRFRDWPVIRLSGSSGWPPDHYRITYHIRGLYAEGNGKIAERDLHVAEIELTLGYPRQAPQCRMLTPIFHPNFDQASICIGDFWAASEGLDDLVIRIGRMIAFQEFNVKSPLNGLAARWAEEHTPHLPVDSREVAPPSAHESVTGERLVIDESLGRDMPAPGGGYGADLPTRNEPSRLSVPQPHLVWTEGAALLRDGITTVGRDASNAVLVEDGTVSSKHATIFNDGSNLLLTDLQSSNGTFLNGRRATEEFLKSGDRIRFGAWETRLEWR